MKKVILLALPVLFFALILTGCDSGGSSESWSNITSLNQVGGTWSGSHSETQTMRKFLESNGETWDPSYQALYGDMNVKMELSMTMTINPTTSMGNGIESQTITFIGGNIDILWPALKSEFAGLGVTVNDANHSILYTGTYNNPITASDLNTVQINEKGTEIRVPLSEFGFSGSGYFVMKKQ